MWYTMVTWLMSADRVTSGVIVHRQEAKPW